MWAEQFRYEAAAIMITVILGPIIGGLLKGLDRKLTARMQGRIGPPLLQPFYDVFKLLGKKSSVSHWTQMLWAFCCMAFIATSLVLLALRQDILMIMFMLALGSVCLVLGALSVKSPYSHIGGNRELVQMLAYEPILFLVALAMFVQTGTFKLDRIITAKWPLLWTLPLAFVALIVVLLIKMRKSPFDISMSHHAHQEIVRGPITEFSGQYLAMIEIAEWYELVLILGLLSFFWFAPIWAGILIALGAYFIVLVIDNITARLTYPILLRFSWTFGVSLVVINMLGIYLLRR
jgi:ech hydrogenase subunit B